MMVAVLQLRSRPLGMVDVHESMQKEFGFALGLNFTRSDPNVSVARAITTTNNIRLDKLKDIFPQVHTQGHANEPNVKLHIA